MAVYLADLLANELEIYLDDLQGEELRSTDRKKSGDSGSSATIPVVPSSCARSAELALASELVSADVLL
jgi:hypothetical protein